MCFFLFGMTVRDLCVLGDLVVDTAGGKSESSALCSCVRCSQPSEKSVRGLADPQNVRFSTLEHVFVPNGRFKSYERSECVLCNKLIVLFFDQFMEEIEDIVSFLVFFFCVREMFFFVCFSSSILSVNHALLPL